MEHFPLRVCIGIGMYSLSALDLMKQLGRHQEKQAHVLSPL